MTAQVKTREEGLAFVKQVLHKLGANEEVKGKVVAVFVASSSVWWMADSAYLEYLVRQLVTLFTYKFEDERMSIPSNMVYLMSADRGAPSILLHWRVYLSLYQPYVKGWRLETIKDSDGRPTGMVAVIVDKEGNEWRWERYYDNLQLVSRWKNKELMFAKTILKEALAIMFPHLNLLPPLSLVETYDPDDVDSTPPVTNTYIAQIRNQTSVHDTKEDSNTRASGQIPPSSSVQTQKSSTDVVRGLASTPPPAERRDKSQDGDLFREIKEKFKVLSDLLGADEALKRVRDLVSEMGANEFKELDTEKKRFVIMNIDNIIFAERKIRGENGASS